MELLGSKSGIGEKSGYTLEEIGQDFEVTRERIRQSKRRPSSSCSIRRAASA
jgi:DNA-directed RNA polymerase sigma subunit (sigma70/sigma32)